MPSVWRSCSASACVKRARPAPAALLWLPYPAIPLIRKGWAMPAAKEMSTMSPTTRCWRWAMAASTTTSSGPCGGLPLRRRYGDRSLAAIQLPPMVGAPFVALMTRSLRRMAIPPRAMTPSAASTPWIARTGATAVKARRSLWASRLRRLTFSTWRRRALAGLSFAEVADDGEDGVGGGRPGLVDDPTVGEIDQPLRILAVGRVM